MPSEMSDGYDNSNSDHTNRRQDSGSHENPIPRLAHANPGPVGVEAEGGIPFPGACRALEPYAIIVEFLKVQPAGAAFLVQGGLQPEWVAELSGGATQDFKSPFLGHILCALRGHFFFLLLRFQSRRRFRSSSHLRLHRFLSRALYMENKP